MVKLVSARPAERECKPSSKNVVFEASPIYAWLPRSRGFGTPAVSLISVFPPPRRVIPGNLKARYHQRGFGNEVFALSHECGPIKWQFIKSHLTRF